MMNHKNYQAKAMGGWLGKNIGGTLGGPHEGKLAVLNLHFYDPVPTEPMANDDLDLQLVWLDMLRRKGVYVTPYDFAECWNEKITYHIAEYFMGQRNLAHGLMPPVTGWFNNWWYDGMGATIRSEIWAMLAPGQPDIAAAYAYMDASVDHCAEGVHGEMLFAAMESEAFVSDDINHLIRVGTRYIPQDSLVRKVVDYVVKGYSEGVDATKLRHQVCAEFAHPIDFTHVVPNVGFIILGLLYGQNPEEKLCIAVNCGYDCDCTAATLGALLGIMYGPECFSERWHTPIGNKIVPGWGIKDIELPPDIGTLTEQTEQCTKMVMSDQDAIRTHLANWTNLDFLKNSKTLSYDAGIISKCVLSVENDIRLMVDYGKTAAIGGDETRDVIIELDNRSDKKRELIITIDAPENMTIVSEPNPVKMLIAPVSTEKCRVKVRTRQLLPANIFTVTVKEDARVVLKSKFSLAGKMQWQLSSPISKTNTEMMAKIERSGKLDGIAVKELELEVDILNSLIPQESEVVYAQTVFNSKRIMRACFVTNSTGLLTVWHNGKCVYDQTHRLAGIMPSCHLSDLGFGAIDVTLEKGANTFMIKLSGDRWPQDVNFHGMAIRANAGDKCTIQDFILMKDANNVTKQ